MESGFDDHPKFSGPQLITLVNTLLFCVEVHLGEWLTPDNQMPRLKINNTCHGHP
jgi:hypothetical protein